MAAQLHMFEALAEEAVATAERLAVRTGNGDLAEWTDWYEQHMGSPPKIRASKISLVKELSEEEEIAKEIDEDTKARRSRRRARGRKIHWHIEI